MKQKYRIPQNIPNDISQNRNFKEVVFYYQLRQFDLSGRLKDYTTHIKSICNCIGISKRKFYYMLKSCIKLKIISKQNKDLIFISNEKLCEVLDVVNTFKYVWIKCNPSELEIHIKLKVLKDNYNTQRKAIYKKIQKLNNEDLQRDELEAARLYLLDNFQQNFISGQPLAPSDIQPDIALSQSKISSMYGRNSQYVGFYWQKKFQLLKLIEINSRVIASIVFNKKTKLIGKQFFDVDKKQTMFQLRNELIFTQCKQ